MRRLASSLAIFLGYAVFAATQVFNFGPNGGQLTPPPSNTPPEKRCVLAGHVVNALTGEPVKKAEISLRTQNGGNAGMSFSPISRQGYSTTSEADGTFRMEGIEPGNYNLTGIKAGFLHTNYGAKKPSQAGTVLSLSPGQQMTDVSFGLYPQAVITGKVVDSDGDPVTGGMVQAVRQTWMRGKLRYMPHGVGQVNDVGEYRIANLSPGKYYLSVQQPPMGRMGTQGANPAPGKPDTRLVRTYYPGATTPDNATTVEVKAGQDLTGMDIRMQSAQTYHIRGKVAGSLPEGSTISVSPRGDQWFPFFGGHDNVKPDGTFDIAGVAPGSYILNYFVLSGNIRSAGHQNVDVGEGDVDGVTLAVSAPGSLRGTVRVEGAPQAGTAQVDASNIHISLMPSEMGGMMGPMPNAKAAKDGSFTLDNISPGKYYVQANAPKGTYLKSVRYGSADVTGKELDLSSGAGGEIEVVYRYGPGEVDGTVQQPQNSAAQSAVTAQILLVPNTLNADGSGVRFGSTNTNGGFTMAEVPPGHYRAYALEEMNSEDTGNPEVLKQLEQKATEVEVKENEKKQIQLPLISSDDCQQLLARAGITTGQ